MHFFINPSLLNTQAAADVFGPQVGSETEKFNISSKHTVSAVAKLFACQDAMMLVCPHIDSSNAVSTSLVNIILKPINSLEIPFTSVKYYIYRGVDRDSLIYNVTGANYPQGVGIQPDAPATRTQFISKFWKNWNAFKTNTNQLALPDPTPQSFGFDTAAAGSVLIESLYNSAQSNNTAINDNQAIRVSEGDWIGNLQTGVSFEFEIITDTDHLTIDLDYVKKHKQIIDATGMQNYEQATTLAPIVKRDTVLNYIDPAAFFGMFYSTGVHINTAYDTSTFRNTTVLKQTSALVSDVINKFLNADAVYLDIRSEKGYSYFFHKNYLLSNTVLELKSETQTSFNALNFTTLFWPLINLNTPTGSLVAITDGDRIELKLLVLDNTKPLVFVQNPKLLGSANVNVFINEADLVDINSAGVVQALTKIIRLEVPHVVNGAIKTNVAHHIKLQYFRQEHASVPAASVFKSANYLDSLYSGIKWPILDVLGPFQEASISKRHFVTNGVFSFVANTGVIVKDTLALFYSENAFSLLASSDFFPELNVTNAAEFDGILKRKNVAYNKVRVTDGAQPIDVIGIIGYNRTSLERTPKENIHLLGLTKTQLDDINTATTALNTAHKYFIFEVVAGTVGYVKYQVKVQGLDASRVLQTIDTFGATANLFVYGTNSNMLCSSSFGAAVNLPLAIPDPGELSEFPSFFRFDYDGNDPLVTDLFPGGIVQIEDKGLTFRPVPSPPDPIVGLLGEIFYPVNTNGSDVLSDLRPQYPVVIINHANGGRYSDYRKLAQHLAKNGFIVSSISCLIKTLRTYPGYLGTDFPLTLGVETLNILAFPYPMASYFFFINLDAVYAFGNDSSNAATYQKLMVLRGVRSRSGFLTDFTYSYEDVLGWKNGTDFDFFAVPAPMVWERRGGVPARGLSKYGLSWNSNTESPPGNFKAILRKAGTKLVVLSAANWALSTYADIILAIDTATNVNSVTVNFPSATINQYLGTIIGGKYYMIRIVSSTSSSAGTAGTRVRIAVEIMDRKNEITFDFDIGRHGMGIYGRANMVYPHLQILRKFLHEKGWSSKFENKIGLIGHSRGAEAVVRCASDIADSVAIPRVNLTTIPVTDPRLGLEKWKYVPHDLHTINAVISLAPTDASLDQKESVGLDIPYYVLYGSMEGDVVGVPVTSGPYKNRTSGFSIYDRSKNNTEKAMSFVYGATHNGFITTNFDYLQNYSLYTANLIDTTKQSKIALAYMNAFMRMHLKGETQWKVLFHGSYIPPSTLHREIYPQFKDMEVPLTPNKFVLDFELSSVEATLNGTPASLAGNLRYGDAVDLDSLSPNDTKAIWVKWSAGDVLNFSVANKNITSYSSVSLRIGHVVDLAAVTYPDLSRATLKLIDTSGTESTATLNTLVPPPHRREDRFTKTQMTTIRVLISAFTSGVNLNAINHLQFIFPAGSGSVIIDDVEFTN